VTKTYGAYLLFCRHCLYVNRGQGWRCNAGRRSAAVVSHGGKHSIITASTSARGACRSSSSQETAQTSHHLLQSSAAAAQPKVPENSVPGAARTRRAGRVARAHTDAGLTSSYQHQIKSRSCNKHGTSSINGSRILKQGLGDSEGVKT